MKLQPWDIVLVSFPFTDLSQQKLRPAVVISSAEVLAREEDCILMFISSVIPIRIAPYEVVMEPTHPEFPGSGLKMRSLFKADKIATLHTTLLRRWLGHAGPHMQVALQGALRRALVV